MEALTRESRAVLSPTQPGQYGECVACGKQVKFAARNKENRVICNVYEDAGLSCDCLVPWTDGDGQHSPGCAIFQKKWVRVEIFHEACYDDRYGEPIRSSTRFNRR